MKLKDGLVREYKKNVKRQKKEHDLRRKYHIPSSVSSLMIVDGGFLRTIKAIIRWIATIFVFLFCAIGILSILYPGTRSEIISVLQETVATIGISNIFQ